MLDEIYYNNTLLNWLISCTIIIVALIINWIITLLNRRYLRVLAKRTKTPIDNVIVNSLETPLKVGIVLIAIWTAFNRLEMSKSFDNTLFKAYEILSVLNITWFIAHLINGLLKQYFLRKRQESIASGRQVQRDTHFVTLIKKIVTFIVWTLGVVIALNNVGLDLKAILGTLGIGGIAIALAAQDTVKNVFGGFTILLDGTFRIGDKIKIAEYEGYVEDIGVRSTKIRNYDKRLITMPNYKIVEGAVINISAAPQLRIVSRLGLVYDTPPELMSKAMDMLEKIALNNPNVSNEGISVAFEDFGASSMNIRFCYFVNDATDTYGTPSVINMEILKQFNDAGLEFAFPTQTLHIAKTTD